MFACNIVESILHQSILIVCWTLNLQNSTPVIPSIGPGAAIILILQIRGDTACRITTQRWEGKILTYKLILFQISRRGTVEAGSKVWFCSRSEDRRTCMN